MDESAIWENFALKTVQIAFNFALCVFPVAVQILTKLHSHPCDYVPIYIVLL